MINDSNLRNLIEKYHSKEGCSNGKTCEACQIWLEADFIITSLRTLVKELGVALKKCATFIDGNFVNQEPPIIGVLDAAQIILEALNKLPEDIKKEITNEKNI